MTRPTRYAAPSWALPAAALRACTAEPGPTGAPTAGVLLTGGAPAAALAEGDATLMFSGRGRHGFRIVTGSAMRAWAAVARGSISVSRTAAMGPGSDRARAL